MGYLKTKIANKYFNDKKQLTSYIVLKVIKTFMRSGKFDKFYTLFLKGVKNTVIYLFKNYQIKINIIDLIIKIVTYLEPFCDVKAVRASGRKVLVPAPLRPQRKIMMAIKFLIHGFFCRHKKFGAPLIRAIREELIILYFDETSSEAFQKKQEFVRNIFFNEKNLRFLKGF